MAKFGIALGSGPRGRGFESPYSDQKTGIRFCGFQFFNWGDGIRKAVKKQSGGLFLGRGRIHRFLNAPGTGVGRKRSWSQDCRMVEISIVSKSHKKESPPRGWAFLFGYCDGIRKAGPGPAGVKTVRWTVFRPWENPSLSERTRYGCGHKAIIVAECDIS